MSLLRPGVIKQHKPNLKVKYTSNLANELVDYLCELIALACPTAIIDQLSE